MPKPLLITKFYIPKLRPTMVPRPHLIERLSLGLDRKLTLISAPAGFGMTTLLSECVQRCEKQVAWVSLDEGDNDSSHFLAYLLTALKRNEPGIGDGLLHALESTSAPDTETILTRLVNEIAKIARPLILVLDNYLPSSPPKSRKCCSSCWKIYLHQCTW